MHPRNHRCMFFQLYYFLIIAKLNKNNSSEIKYDLFSCICLNVLCYVFHFQFVFKCVFSFFSFLFNSKKLSSSFSIKIKLKLIRRMHMLSSRYSFQDFLRRLAEKVFVFIMIFKFLFFKDGKWGQPQKNTSFCLFDFYLFSL